MRKLQRPLRKLHRLATIPMAILFPFNIATKNYDFHNIIELITAVSMIFMILTGVAIYILSMKKKKIKDF